MQITAIKTFMARFGSRPRCLLKVETDEGLYGLGQHQNRLAGPGQDAHFRLDVSGILGILRRIDQIWLRVSWWASS